MCAIQIMNEWIRKSLAISKKPGYLNELHKVYPIEPSKERILDTNLWEEIREAFVNKNNQLLLTLLIDKKNEVFPIKDGMIGYFRAGRDSIASNPKQVDRITGYLYEMGYDEMKKRASRPKESNQTIGPMFDNWVQQVLSKNISFPMRDLKDFEGSDENAILWGSDKVKGDFAKKYLGYSRNKGLDFIARVNGKYIVGEAKWITTPGGNQNKSFDDAKQLATNSNINNEVHVLIILDGVLYCESTGEKSLYINLTKHHKELNIISALLLEDYINGLM
jgi:hypothetical protein